MRIEASVYFRDRAGQMCAAIRRGGRWAVYELRAGCNLLVWMEGP